MQYIAHDYQKDGEDKIVNQSHLALFWEMGLGKSVTTLSAIRRLKFDQYAVNKVLIIAPKKVAEGTWTGEKDKWDHLSFLRVSLVAGTEKQRIAALLKRADVYVIGRDNVVWLVEHYRNDWPFDMVVIDELSSFKNPQAKRFKALKAVLPHIRRVVGLTGTPAPNGLEDLWAQVYLLDQGKRLGKTITWYRDNFFSYNPYSHERKALSGTKEYVENAIKDICFSLEAKDYLRMPDLIFDDLPVVLDAAARKQYTKMEQELLLELDETTITAQGAAALCTKLLQMCAGAVYDNDGRAAEIHACKLEALKELVEGLQGQSALLFYGYKHDVPRIVDAIRQVDKRLRIRTLSGDADCRAWNGGEVDILLAHPASCAYGLNLQDGGRHVIWFGLNWSLELYQQANARLYRQGQRYPVFIHRLIVTDGMDVEVARALNNKQSEQSALMGALKARITRVKSGER